MDYAVISADNHIIDPRELYVENLPAEFRERAPRSWRRPTGERGGAGRDGPPARTFGLEAVAGQPTDGKFRASGLCWEEILPGNYDGAEHLKDMDRDGIDAAVLYPSAAMASYVLPDRKFALAVLRRTTTGCSTISVASTPSVSSGSARCPSTTGWPGGQGAGALRREGAKGFFLPGAPAAPTGTATTTSSGGRRATSTVRCSFHRNHGGRAPASRDLRSADTPGINVGGIVVRFFSAVQPFTYMIYTGVFERFPTLQLVAGEVNCGWLPFWRQTLDQNFEQQRHWASLPFDHLAERHHRAQRLRDRARRLGRVRRAPRRSHPRRRRDVLDRLSPQRVAVAELAVPSSSGSRRGWTTPTRTKVLAGNAARVYHLT